MQAVLGQRGRAEGASMTTRTPLSQYPWIRVREITGNTYPRWVVDHIVVHEQGDTVVRNYVSAETTKVLQGWPDYDRPAEVVKLNVFLDEEKNLPRADGVVQNSFNPGKGESGPHFFLVYSPFAVSEVAEGFGLPLRQHYGFEIYWKYVKAGNTPPPDPTPTPDEWNTVWLEGIYRLQKKEEK